MARTAGDFDELSATGGEVAGQMRLVDWAATPLGPPDAWPQSLRASVRTVLTSRFAMWMGWGPELTFFYNDAYRRATLATKHPWALGRPAQEVWAEIWDDIGPRVEHVMTTRDATWDEALLLFLERSGYREETYHTFSYSPLAGDDGRTAGMLCVVAEETERVLAERRMATLRDLATDLGVAVAEDEVCRAVERRLGQNPRDLPFTLTYLLDGGAARLACATGVAAGDPVAPPRLDVAADGIWPLAELLDGGHAATVDLAGVAGLPAGEWSAPPREAVVVPLAERSRARTAGFLVAGVNPFRLLDGAYRGFLELVAGQIASSVASARAREAERQRAAALAELDRAKTAFFQNVSHEFRTPLTLILGPLRRLTEQAELPSGAQEQVSLAQGNADRLLQLVNSLLDFSRLEAGSLQGTFRRVDLAATTEQLASMFRSAVEGAGLELAVDCPPLPAPVYVDVAMWEKVVLNLLSNAFKFTFDGRIEVRLAAVDGGAELVVSDTGEGIAPEELPRLFTRFHRVRGAKARTHEGSGIGLALVEELTRLHGGTVAVESEPGSGTAVTVRLPFGAAHLPEAGVEEAAPAAPVGGEAAAFVNQAIAWSREPARPADSGDGTDRARVLVVDDNADMREYLLGLLEPRYAAEAVPNGAAALRSVAARLPDLVVTDAMMPELDGLELLRTLRSERRTRSVPVIMLSARAGEGSAVEGLEAGADDYLVKPFSGPELLARVQAGIDTARRNEDEQRRREEESLRFFELSLDIMGVAGFDGYLRRVNPAYERALGWSEEELLARPYMELVHPEDRERVAAVLARIATGGEARDLEVRVLRRDGGHSWYVVSGLGLPEEQLVYFVGTDVTRRRTAEEQRRRLAEILEATSDFVGIAEPGGRALYVNAAGRRMTGFPADADVTASTMFDFLPARAAERIATEVLPAVIERGSWRGETAFRDRDGQEFPAFQEILAHRSDAGEVELLSTIARDISREKQAEALVAMNATILERVARRQPLPVVLDALALAIEAQAGGMLASVLLVADDGTHLRHGSAPSLPDAYNAAIDGIAIGAAVGSCGTAAHRGEPVIVEDIAVDPLWADFRELAAEHELRSCWSTPVTSTTGEVLGTFALYYREPRAPDDVHLQLVEAATHLARMAIEHDRAERQLSESEERFRTVVTEVPVGIFEADADGRNTLANERLCEIMGRSPEQLRSHQWADRLHPEDRDRVIANWRAAVHARTGWMDEFRVVTPDGTVRHVAATATPLTDERGSVTGFLGSCADVTEHKEAEERRREFEREHLIAQTLQRSLLPGRLPTTPGVEIAARYLAGAAGMEVGGDWYDVFELDGGRIGVALGDVVGRGLGAAATMGRLRMALRTIARSTASPARALARLSELEGDDDMATLVYGIVDPQSGTLHFASAGHPPPLLARADARARYLDGGLNPPLGVRHASMEDAVVDLAPDCTLVLYTDGLVERRGESIDVGLASLQEIVSAHEGDLETLCDGAIARLDAESSGDDVAMLALRLRSLAADGLALTLPSDARHLRSLRTTLRRWLGELGAEAEDVDAVTLAVSEALGNAMTHAYGLDDGLLEVRGGHAAGEVSVTVRDFGTWRPPRGGEGGRGLLMMRSLMDEVVVDTGGSGTEVRMRRALGESRPVVPAEAPPVTGSAVEETAVAVLRLDGDVDLGNVAAVAERLRGAVSNRHAALVVDLTGCGYLDSAGIRLLFDSARRLRLHRQQLRLAVPDGSPLLRPLAITGLDRVAPRSATVAAAIASIGAYDGA